MNSYDAQAKPFCSCRFMYTKWNPQGIWCCRAKGWNAALWRGPFQHVAHKSVHYFQGVQCRAKT